MIEKPLSSSPLYTLFMSRTATVFLLTVVMVAGLYLRIDNLDHWLKNKNQYFTSSGLPVTLGVDPYYYIDIADELLKGKIEKLDERRHFPVGTERPVTLPLLSALLALFTFISQQPIEWIAILLPPFLGILLAIPIYLLGYTLVIDAQVPLQGERRINKVEAKITGLTAALAALLSPPFVVRSSVGACDTDSLNVFFAALCAYLALCFYKTENKSQRVQSLALWCATTLLFLWWWDQVVLPVLVLATVPMLPAAVFRWSEVRKNLTSYLIVIVPFLIILIGWQGSSLVNIHEQFFSLYTYISGAEQESIFPPLEQLVQEQDDVTFSAVAMNMAGNVYLYIFSLVGLIFLLVLSRKKFLVLFPFLLLNILSFSAMRFMVFLAPLFGLGIGALVLALLILTARFKYVQLVTVPPLICLFSWLPFSHAQLYNAAPPLLAPVVYDGIQELAAVTPENSVIWSSWGHGHPLVYYAKRRTIGDGMYHPAFLDFVLKYPLASNNFRLAANWMQFYTVHGEDGLAEAFQHLTGNRDDWENGFSQLSSLLAAGVEQSRNNLLIKHAMQPADTERFLSFLFPADSPPIYVFMDYMLISENWFEVGRWNLKKRSGPPPYTLIPVYNFSRGGSSLKGISGLGAFNVNMLTGVCFFLNSSQYNLKKILIDTRDKSLFQTFPNRARGHNLYLAQDKVNNFPYGLLADHHVSNTVMIQLFFAEKSNQDYFTPVTNRLPSFLTYKVHGEKYVP